MIETGLEVFLKKEHKQFQKLRLGVVCNQASVTRDLKHISQHVLNKKYKLNVTAFFGPQHGIRGEKQDNMVESDDYVDPVTGIPVYSLYGYTREPVDKMMANIDAFVIDLQDIGTRIYTFMYTMANCMRAAKRKGLKVIVLDRPNPINAISTEGNILDPDYVSFVGQFPMAVRHGLTMGELAQLFNNEFGIGCDLQVVKMKGYKRTSWGDMWDREWTPPSPNIPVLSAAVVFPGMVHFEGTNISEGRGTTRPFDWVGAPFIDADKLAEHMNQLKLKGVYFRPIFFQPTFHKGKDQVCGGVHTHVTNRAVFNAFEAGVHLLSAIHNFYPNDLKWKQPPYEYISDRLPIDVIAGTDALRLAVEKGNVTSFLKKSKEEAKKFQKVAKKYWLYK